MTSGSSAARVACTGFLLLAALPLAGQEVRGVWCSRFQWASAANYPTHVYYQHGNPTDPAHQDWLLFDNAGNPAAFNEYYWMNPGIPDADAHVRREAAYIVSHYDVDGLHFDRARMYEIGYG